MKNINKLAAAISSFFVMVCVYFFWFSFVRWKPKYNGDYEDKARNQFQPYENKIIDGKKWIHRHRDDRIVINSQDGLKLVGFYIPAERESNNTILFMHGYRSDSYKEFSCLAEFYHRNGYNLLIAHQRCHGESEGRYIGFGVLERFDCKLWIEYLNKRFGVDQNIYLAGVSMGCATVLMTLGLSIPANVKGVIADCGFTSPYEIFKHIIKTDFHLPPFPILQIESFFCKRIAGYGFKDCSTLDILKENEVPVLFIHGGRDNYVPTWMGKANYNACKGPKELLIIEHAKHANCSMESPFLYQKTVLRFLENTRKQNSRF